MSDELIAELLDHCERLRTAMHAMVPTHSGTMETCNDLGCIQHRELKARITAGLASGSQRRAKKQKPPFRELR